MNTQVSEKEGLQQGTTPEDRFFGTRHEVDLSGPKPGDKVEIEETQDDESGATTGRKAADESGNDEHGDEIEEYSERVQKRINKLTWQAKEAERKLQSITAERDEAFRATQTLYGQNQQYQQIIHNGEAHLIARMKQAADAAVANAEAKYRKAYEDGDTDAIIAAQKAMIAAQGQANEAASAENDYRFRASQQQQRQQPVPQQFQQRQQQFQQQQPRPEVAEWAENNPWFMDKRHRDMTAVALSEHERLVEDEHVAPHSQEYYEKIDAKMRSVFPTYFKKSSGTSAPASVETVVASAERSASGGTPRKVKLTPSALKLAKRLGLTPEQYANQVLKDRGLL